MVELFSEIIGLDLSKKVRHAHYVAARYACFLWLRQNTILSFSQIAKMFGMKHCTVLYGVNEMVTKLSINDELCVRYWSKIKDLKLDDIIKKATEMNSDRLYSFVYTICG